MLDSVRQNILMFSGQGSQYFQMGRHLFETAPVFRKWMLHLDELAADLTGRSVVRSLYGERTPAEHFDEIALTNPALFMVQYSLWMHASSIGGMRGEFAVGSSLGSFVAAAVAQAISATDALHVVIRLAQAAEQHCERGAMTAVLTSRRDLDAVREAGVDSFVAAINFREGFVLSSGVSTMRRIERELLARNIAYQRLPVHFGFHSPMIDPMKDAALGIISSVRICTPVMRLICCASAQPVVQPTSEYFWSAIRETVLLQRTIEVLQEQRAMNFIDFSPTGTMSACVKGIVNTHAVHSIVTLMNRFNGRVADIRV